MSQISTFMDACQKNLMALRKEGAVLWTLFLILLVLWGLGLMTGYALSSVIHVLLMIAIIVALILSLQVQRRG